MNLLELFPIIATTCLIIGDLIQLERVFKAAHCRSVSLSKWLLSVIANSLLPFYYYYNGHLASTVVALVLWSISVGISVLIIIRRHKSEAN